MHLQLPPKYWELPLDEYLGSGISTKDYYSLHDIYKRILRKCPWQNIYCSSLTSKLDSVEGYDWDLGTLPQTLYIGTPLFR